MAKKKLFTIRDIGRRVFVSFGEDEGYCGMIFEIEDEGDGARVFYRTGEDLKIKDGEIVATPCGSDLVDFEQVKFCPKEGCFYPNQPPCPCFPS